MADPYVIFPGTPGVNIQTDDVNRLDAETSGQQQGGGVWIAYSNVVGLGRSQAVTPVYGDWCGRYAASGNGVASSNIRTLAGTSGIPVSGSEEYSVSAYMGAAIAGLHFNVNALFYTAAGVADGTAGASPFVSAPQGALAENGFTFTTPATTAFAQVQLSMRPDSAAMIANSDIFFDAVCLRQGDVPSFVPSLDIVGSLYEETVPVDMPVVYAPGSPLTVGEGWVGNGYAYNRYDGPDSSAPLVASFLASDIPVASQLPG